MVKVSSGQEVRTGAGGYRLASVVFQLHLYRGDTPDCRAGTEAATDPLTQVIHPQIDGVKATEPRHDLPHRLMGMFFGNRRRHKTGDRIRAVAITPP